MLLRKDRIIIVAIITSLLLFVGAAFSLTYIRLHVDRWPPDFMRCPSCNRSITRIRYGPASVEPSLPAQRLPNGKSYRGWTANGEKIFDGGPEARRTDPGWICESCGKTWLLPLAEYYGRKEIPIRLELGISWFWKRVGRN